jgi:hypothetical protein
VTQDLLARLEAALQDRYRIERPLGAGGMATVSDHPMKQISGDGLRRKSGSGWSSGNQLASVRQLH